MVLALAGDSTMTSRRVPGWFVLSCSVAATCLSSPCAGVPGRAGPRMPTSVKPEGPAPPPRPGADLGRGARSGTSAPGTSPSTDRDQCAHRELPVAGTGQRSGGRVGLDGPAQADLLAQHEVRRVLGAGRPDLLLHDVVGEHQHRSEQRLVVAVRGQPALPGEPRVEVRAERLLHRVRPVERGDPRRPRRSAGPTRCRSRCPARRRPRARPARRRSGPGTPGEPSSPASRSHVATYSAGSRTSRCTTSASTPCAGSQPATRSAQDWSARCTQLASIWKVPPGAQQRRRPRASRAPTPSRSSPASR